MLGQVIVLLLVNKPT